MQGYVNNLKAGLSHSHALSVPCATGTVECPLPPSKSQASQMWSGRCSGCLSWFCAWNLNGTSQPGDSPSSVSPGTICPISPTPLPAAACFQHGIAEHPTKPVNIRASPKPAGPAGFKFLILPLWASFSLLAALALMPTSCLPPQEACTGACELTPGPTAVMLNLLCSKRRLSKDLLPAWGELEAPS